MESQSADELRMSKLDLYGDIGVSLPRISIVTPSLNQGSFIEEALESVRLQNYDNWEHIVVDGGSIDDTVERLQNLGRGTKGSRLKWVSEADRGQSNALNKGFRQADGAIVGWLNADDRYKPGCFERIVKAFLDYPDVDVFYGDYVMVDVEGNPLQVRREIDFNDFILKYHRVLYIATTATFFRRKVFDEDNLIEEKLHYAMDFEFLTRLARKGYRFRHIPTVLADYRLQPNSKTCSAPDMQDKEQRRVVDAMTPTLQRLRPLGLQRFVRLFLQFIAGVERYSEKALRGYYRADPA
jgi:glycosyltransferase involved in cell wall biosynthesis